MSRHDYEDIRDYMDKDLAGTNGLDLKGQDSADERLAAEVEVVREQGFIVLPELLSKHEVQEIKDALEPHFQGLGRTGIEGFKTRRVYSVTSKTRTCDKMLAHPRILALIRSFLHSNFLLSQLQAIKIEAGEKSQPIHFDDMIYPTERPRPPLSVATVWALDDFTADNGATVAIPGSHEWDDRSPVAEDEVEPTIMPAGSVLFFLGTLWHGGGANRSDVSRFAVSAQYCQPWLRGQENLAMGTPRELVRKMPTEIQKMLGYSIYPPFMGMVDGLHPNRLLDTE